MTTQGMTTGTISSAGTPLAGRSTSTSCPITLRTNIGNVATLDDAVAAFNPIERIKGRTIIRVRP